MNQGLFSFYRGQSPFALMLLGQQFLKYSFYDALVMQLQLSLPSSSIFQQQVLASSISSVAFTTLFYPLDLCHSRMSCDMTKKQSVYSDNSKARKVELTQNHMPIIKSRMYNNVFDCFRKSQMKQGQIGSQRNLRMLY